VYEIFILIPIMLETAAVLSYDLLCFLTENYVLA